MSKYDFMKQLEIKLKDSGLSDDWIISSGARYGNNEVKKYGIFISRNKEVLSYSFYIDRYYDDYCKKKMTLDEACDEILYRFDQMNKKNRFSPDILLNIDNFLDDITYKLVSVKKNPNILKNIPHVPFLDMALVFYISNVYLDDVLSNVQITNSMMEFWNVDTDDLFRLAEENTPRLLPYKTVSLSSVMMEFFEADNLSGLSPEPDEDPPIYILSNRDCLFGATALAYPGITEKLKEIMKGSFFIIPSSVHEVLVVPYTGSEDLAGLTSILNEVNGEFVRNDEILSDTVYCYDAAKEQFYF